MSRVGSLLRGMRLAKQRNLTAMAAELEVAPRRLELVEIGAAFPSAAERRAWASKLGFADLLDFDRQWRDSWPGLSLAQRDGQIPIINQMPAGPPIDYQEYGIDSSVGYEYVPRSADMVGLENDILFAVIVVGDSMIPTWNEGDLVIFRPMRPEDCVPDGSPVFVRFSAEHNHTCTFKRLWTSPDGQIELRPENPKHQIMIVPPQEIDRMALAIQCRPNFATVPRARRMVRDEYVQEFPESG
jgi:SOS-response transcriptional repressor LexA